MSANGHDYLLVDILSDAAIGNPPAKQRIIAAILDENDRSWFIKMTGDDCRGRGATRRRFTNFLRSLKIP